MSTSSYDSSSSAYGEFPGERSAGKRTWTSKRGKEKVIEGRRIRIFEGRIKRGNVKKTGNQLWVTINEKRANMPYVREAVSNQLRKETLKSC